MKVYINQRANQDIIDYQMVVNIMAKPIRRTPVLRGDDAKLFVKKMIDTEKRADQGKLTNMEKEVIKMFKCEDN